MILSFNEVSTGSGSDRVFDIWQIKISLEATGRYHHPTRAARAGTPVRSRY